MFPWTWRTGLTGVAVALACAGGSATLGERISEARWVAPTFANARHPGQRRVVVWFDHQLLGTGTGYAERTRQWADSPRRALRSSVITELEALSATSFAAARPEIERLEGTGLLRDCRRHWIVNGFTCELPGGDPAVLDAVPGVSKVFLAPPADRSAGEEIGPRQIADRPVAPPFQPNADPGTWNLQRLGIPKVWHKLGRTGKGVLVVIHDAGFQLDVAPLGGTLYRNPGEIAGNGIDDEGDGYVDDVHGYAFDTRDTRINAPKVRAGGPIHGNAVAAIVAGRRPIGERATIGGAPDAVWAAVTGDGSIEEAIEWSLKHNADIYSMSFSIGGLGDFRAHWRKVMEHAALAGLFLVSGAGNFAQEGRDDFQPIPVQMRIPEDVPLAVFGVTGVGPNGVRPPFSSQGPVDWSIEHYREGRVDKPDFATINGGVPALGADGRIEARPGKGNSYASPHMAAVLALMVEADPDLTPWAARQILIDTAEDVGTPGFDFQYGFGVVDAFRAVEAVEARRGRR